MSIEPKPRPHMIAVAIGDQRGDLPPRPIAIGAKPNMVVREVRIMGRMRTWHPLTIAK